jgi:two-component system cell cycle sensor histidine kinase PleC
MRISCESVDLTPLIEETLRLTSIVAQEKEISIHQKFSKSLGINADRRALKQVMLNILSNAVKFTNEGGNIELRAKRTSGGILMTIADTGIGIPKDALSKIGQPFEQVQSQYAKSKGGSGLGLAISRSLVALHGGRMRIRSKVGRGTIVSLHIPDLPMQAAVRKRIA